MTRLIDADALLEALADKFVSVNGNVIELINNAPTVQREGWVSVEDRLPELGQWYLIFVKDKFSTMAFLDTNTETGETLWLAHNNNFQGEWENVTHWQPLPEPPTA